MALNDMLFISVFNNSVNELIYSVISNVLFYLLSKKMLKESSNSYSFEIHVLYEMNFIQL